MLSWSKNLVLFSMFLCILLVFPSLSSARAAEYYEAETGDIVSVNYQRYESDGTPKDGGTLTVFCGEGSIPTNLADQYPDALTVIRGFWLAIIGGNSSAKNYTPPMKEGDEKKWVVIPPEDGYTDPGHPLYGQTLYFDIELNEILHDALIEPLSSENTSSSSTTDSATQTNNNSIAPGFHFILVVSCLFLLFQMKRKS